jgi:hypothetical protein
MTAMKGYYCLVQFCPDMSRLEAVNVGVVLYCPDARFIAARTARSNRNASKLVGRAAFDASSLNSAKRALERRLQVDRIAFCTLDDLNKFVDTRANAIKLTAPRPIKVFEPQQDLDKLYEELVGGVARKTSLEPVVLPELDAVFHELHAQGRAKLDWPVTVPVVRRPLRVPYAYRNSAWNLVKPFRFSSQEGLALAAAMRLAIEGDLLQKHQTQDDEKMKLIVVASFEQHGLSDELQDRVDNVLGEYKVRTVRDAQIEPFLSEVRQEARS